jgi:trehalose synthase
LKQPDGGWVTDVPIGIQPLTRFRPAIQADEFLFEAVDYAQRIRQRLAGRVVWNVNSTAAGGGVAEMLQSLLPYVRSTGIDTRWSVMKGPPEFFRVTKRLHHALHGSSGDGTPLDDEAQALYEATARENAAELCSMLRPHDFVVLHDPQTAGLAPHLIDAGALVIWRCHIGHDIKDTEVERGWRFLFPYLREVPAFVFSRAAYVPAYCDHSKSSVITPSIDALSPKNQDMDEATVRAILVHVGLVAGDAGDGVPIFLREDSSPARVDRCADIVRLGPPPAWTTPLVVQVSRWDPLKDPIGVMEGFTQLAGGVTPGGAELVLAGPNVHAVADDPEGASVFEELIAAWRQLPHSVRRRVHLASLPMADVQENAAIVNALQRHAAVVVQKSLQEGFGLTVTEAMWKSRPVVASAVGGIQDQIDDGVHGLLLKDPRDLEEFGAAVRRLLEDPDLSARLGQAAHERVRQEFLGLHHLLKYARLLERVDRAYEGEGRPARFVAPVETQ